MGDEGDVPERFLCPISFEPMRDPVLTLSGNCFDRDSIRRAFQEENEDTFPADLLSKERLSSDVLVSNHALRSEIQEWMQKRGNNEFGLREGELAERERDCARKRKRGDDFSDNRYVPKAHVTRVCYALFGMIEDALRNNDAFLIELSSCNIDDEACEAIKALETNAECQKGAMNEQ